MKEFISLLIGAILAVVCSWVESKYKILGKVSDWIRNKLGITKYLLPKEIKKYIVDNKNNFKQEYEDFVNALDVFCNLYKENIMSKYNESFNDLNNLMIKGVDKYNIDIDLLDCFYNFINNTSRLKGAEKVEFTNVTNKFMNLINEINKKIEDSSNAYVDVNDKKLKKDINRYEPYLHYWDNSDQYVIDIIKQVSLLRLRKNRTDGVLRILDIGGGDGRLTHELARNNDIIMFVEPDPIRIEEAKKKLSNLNVEYFNKKFEKIKWDNIDLFDIILCSHVIQHISTERYEQIVAQLRYLLKNDGLIFLMCPLSFTKNNEYVVHGLEYDVWRIDKNEIENSDYKINNILGTFKMHKLERNCSIYEEEDYKGYGNNNMIMYELQERKDCCLLYKRVLNEGLVGSLPRDIDLQKDKIRVRLGDIIKFNEPYNLELTDYSRQWLIGKNDQQSIEDYQIAVKVDNSTVNTYLIKKAISDHSYYNQQIQKKEIPIEFKEALKDKVSKPKIIQQDQENRWLVIDSKTKTTIAWIIKTQDYYLLIDNLEAQHRLTYDDFKHQYLNSESLGKNIVYDSEFCEGFLISEQGVYTHFLRIDNDWLRLFKRTCMSDQEIEPVLKSESTNLQENIVDVFQTKKDCIWNIKRSENDKSFGKLIPEYCVMKVSDYSSSEKYFIYRAKRYTRLSKYVFDQLCTKEISKYKILPTHHFVKNKLVKLLKKHKLQQMSFISYHLGREKCFLDKFVLRDKLFNVLKLNSFRCFREWVKARDCLIIIKKNEK